MAHQRMDSFSLQDTELDQEACTAVRLIPLPEKLFGVQRCHWLFFLYLNTLRVEGKLLTVAQAKTRAGEEGWCDSQGWVAAKQACGFAWARTSSVAGQAALAAGGDPKVATASTVAARLSAAQRANACVPLTQQLVSA